MTRIPDTFTEQDRQDLRVLLAAVHPAKDQGDWRLRSNIDSCDYWGAAWDGYECSVVPPTYQWRRDNPCARTAGLWCVILMSHNRGPHAVVVAPTLPELLAKWVTFKVTGDSDFTY